MKLDDLRTDSGALKQEVLRIIESAKTTRPAKQINENTKNHPKKNK
jgi:hypothetical protein